MSDARRSYETTYIVNASLEDSQIEAAITHVTEVIERNGGVITATNRWGRKRMAYAIEKKNNGYYVNVEFDGPGQLIAQLERVYLLDENILRFLTIQLDKRALEARAKTAAETTAAAAPAPETPKTDQPETDQPETDQKETETRAPLFTGDGR
ncbi:MAG TPA: 30S ribosomal protein S6 [Bacteroidota bacterium]|nr:30S ribosomal protein S6 [Bacteroidota bacterium]